MFSEKLLHYFPPPQFLATPYAGLSMSDSHIRTVQFEPGVDGQLRLKKYAELPLPVGAITSGRVNNQPEIIHVLEDLKKQTGIEYVRVSIPEEKAYLFEMEVPLVKPNELRSAIGFKIEENVPLPADQVTFDFVVLPQHESHGHLKVVVSALPSKFVNIYMGLFESAKLIPFVFEIESQALARALLAPHDTGTYLIVHFSKSKIGVCVTSEGVVRFTSTLPTSESWTVDTSPVVAEIRKVVTFWKTKAVEEGEEKKDISSILVSGDMVADTVTSEISSALAIPVVRGNVWKNVCDITKVVPDISFEESLQYTASIGLALPSDSYI